jgi:hypothetical protein
MSPAAPAAHGFNLIALAPGASDVTQLVLSIDVEEDEWGVRPGARGVTNVAELPAFARRIAALGVRPTFFVSWVVASDVRAMAKVQEAAAIARGEIGAHLHPWSTPPFDPVPDSVRGALSRYPVQLQRAKLEVLTETLAGATGEMPRAFRAGRLSLSMDTARALLDVGYAIDSSVCAYWMPDDDCVQVPVPRDAWRGSWSIAVPGATRALVEVPLGSGFSRARFAHWAALARLLDTRVARGLRLPGIANRVGRVNRLVLSPEIADVAEMLALWGVLRRGGAGVAQLFLHSPSLRPGLTPYARDEAGVHALVVAVERFVEHAAREGGLQPATMSEAVARTAAVAA